MVFVGTVETFTLKMAGIIDDYQKYLKSENSIRQKNLLESWKKI